MYLSKNEYLRLISESPLFTYDREKEKVSYLKESRKMVGYLYGYLMVDNAIDNEKFGVEIFETASYCIKNYDSTKADFFQYFLSSWKVQRRRLRGDEAIEKEYRGIHITEKNQRTYKRFFEYAKKNGVRVDSSEFAKAVSLGMGITIDEAEDLRKMLCCSVEFESSVSEDGEEISIWDIQDSGIYTDSNILEEEKVQDILDLIEAVFICVQNRQKKLLSKLLTLDIVDSLCEKQNLLELVKTYSFFDENIYLRYICKNEYIKVKDIAEEFGLDEASVSRTRKQFRKKLILKMNESSK